MGEGWAELSPISTARARRDLCLQGKSEAVAEPQCRAPANAIKQMQTSGETAIYAWPSQPLSLAHSHSHTDPGSPYSQIPLYTEQNASILTRLYLLF